MAKWISHSRGDYPPKGCAPSAQEKWATENIPGRHPVISVTQSTYITDDVLRTGRVADSERVPLRFFSS